MEKRLLHVLIWDQKRDDGYGESEKGLHGLLVQFDIICIKKSQTTQFNPTQHLEANYLKQHSHIST